jgi:hypothetical protein
MRTISSRNLLALALSSVLALSLATAAGAAAKKVKREVKVTEVGSFVNDGSTIRFEDKLSGNPRCVKALTAQKVVFITKPDQNLDPSAQVQVTEGGGFYNLPESQRFPLQRVGPGHARGTFSNGQAVTFLHADGAYGGTYSLLKWWRGMGGRAFPPPDSFSDYSDFSIVRAGRKDSSMTKVKFKRGGTKYVFRCGIALSDFPPANPPAEGVFPEPYPVPGTWRFGT